MRKVLSSVYFLYGLPAFRINGEECIIALSTCIPNCVWSSSKLIAGFFVMHRAIRAMPSLFSSASTMSPRLKV